MEKSPDEKQLEATSFVVHATRGVIRDRNSRRKAMLFLLALALLLLILGFTILAPGLNPREHPWRVILFWIVCICFTFPALLPALSNLLWLGLEAGGADRAFGEKWEAARSHRPSSKSKDYPPGEEGWTTPE